MQLKQLLKENESEKKKHAHEESIDEDKLAECSGDELSENTDGEDPNGTRAAEKDTVDGPKKDDR